MARGEAVLRAESGKKKPKKVLDHMEIHPKMGGGHTVKHVYMSYEHEPKDHNFGKNEGKKMMSHIAHHIGLPGYSKREESETEDEFTDTDKDLAHEE